jgi:D-amino peptidase
MKVFVSVDMEGISGVVSPDQTLSDHKDYERFRKLMTADANAAIEGALAGGAESVLVNDSHGPMTNILIEELNPAAELISGSPKPLSMMQGLDNSADVAFLVGYHSRAGTGGSVISHTYSGIVTSLSLNGQVVGETGLNAALAGGYGVPVVLVTGDAAVTREAAALLGNIETVAVKEGVGWRSARCLAPEVARHRIREAAERAVKSSVPPFVLDTPVTLRVAFARPIQADMAALVPHVERLDGVTLQYVAKDVAAAHFAFRAMVALGNAA